MNIISKFSASLLAFCVVACAPEKEAPTPATPEPEAEAPEAVVETTPTPEAVETSEEVSIPGKVVPFTLGSLDAFALRQHRRSKRFQRHWKRRGWIANHSVFRFILWS